jgi:hypothetical protein
MRVAPDEQSNNPTTTTGPPRYGAPAPQEQPPRRDRAG